MQQGWAARSTVSVAVNLSGNEENICVLWSKTDVYRK